jgi:hypothetical protein
VTMTNDGTITNEGVTADPNAPSPRLQEFQAEVHELKVTGGRANPERTGKIIGGLMMLVGLILAIVGYFTSHGTTDPLEQNDAQVLAIIGLTVAVIGTGLYVVFSLTRYLRYWLVRLIYEQRDSTDRIIRGR